MIGLNPRDFELCPMAQMDCAAMNSRGRCVALKDIDYGPDKPCPFYKTADQKAAENAKTRDRLVSIGRADLLAKYHEDELYEPV